MTVLEILKSDCDWYECPSAYPDVQGVEEALATGMTEEEVAEKLDVRAHRQPASPDTWSQKLWLSFGGGCHFRLLFTRQALGLAAADPVSPSKAPARLFEDALELMMLGWHYTGHDGFLDLSTSEGQVEFARRMAFADYVPLSWRSVDPLLYRYLVVTDRLPSTIPTFGVRVSEQLAAIRGFDGQKWLDNEWCVREHKPPVWLPGGGAA